MDILETLEVRWFLADDAPLDDALRRFDGASVQARRTDLYWLTGRDDLGIKVRETPQGATLFETKYRAGSLGGLILADGLEGALERWNKISVRSEELPADRRGWIAVTKERRMLRFALDHDRVVEAPAGELVPAACNVELTRLSYRQDDRQRFAWTLGLETSAPASEALGLLRSVGAALFGGGATGYLAGSLSFGYPAWLRQCCSLTTPP